MTDELEKLRAAMRDAQPVPDQTARAKNMRMAQEKFETLQGTAPQARPTSEGRTVVARLRTGVFAMFNSLTTRGGLAATTAIVAFGLVVISPQGRSLLVPAPQFPSVQELEIPLEEIAATEGRREVADTATAAKSLDDSLRSRENTEPVLGRAVAVGESDLDSELSGSVAYDEGVAQMVAPAPSTSDLRLQIPETNTETFSNAAQNPLKIAAQEPVSTFSVDVDTASYAVLRSSLSNGMLPAPDSIRVEEMINYFPYNYPAPDADTDADLAPFKPTVSLMETPWNADTRLLHIALQGQMPALADRPPLNLVFLIDTSGSMQEAKKLPLLKQSFRLMLGQLRPEDQVAIVTYAGSAGQVLEATPAADKSTILAALERLEAGGSTAGQDGLEQAYSVAEGMANPGDVTRVILATDGDFNVGISDPSALKDFIADKRDTGTYLSVLGFGRGNLDDETMQSLAQNGNGQAAYIDTLNEAQKVLVDQLTGALFPIANDVKIQIEFNPLTVSEYRLIGYETRGLNREDFNNDRVDAGEIGAGHSVTALYEITPVGSPAQLNDPLRYSAETTEQATSDELGFLRLRYKSPGADTSQLIETPILFDVATVDDDVRFSAAIAGFGQLLRGSNYLSDWGWDDSISLAASGRGADEFGYRAEAIALMRLAQSLND